MKVLDKGMISREDNKIGTTTLLYEMETTFSEIYWNGVLLAGKR